LHLLRQLLRRLPYIQTCYGHEGFLTLGLQHLRQLLPAKLNTLVDMRILKQACLINGDWIPPADSKIPVYNPSNTEWLGFIPHLDDRDVLNAIDAAYQAFSSWRETSSARRSELLEALYQEIRAHEEELALLITLENGKPLAEARGEIRYTASFVRWFAQESRRIYGETIPGNTPTQRIIVQKEPVGVCAMITPWNFPSAMLGRKIAAALAAGCTVVAKPAESTPFSAIALGVLAEKVGFPKGVLNIVTGDPQRIGMLFCQSSRIAKISFTGSTRVGRLLMAQSAGTLKRMSLELGGNAPFVVCEDASLQKAIDGVMASKFRNCGQTCIASNRFLIHRSMLHAFVSGVKERIEALRIGDGRGEVELGPMISKAAVEKVRGLLQDAVQRGATIVSGRIPDGESLFVSPVMLLDAGSDTRIWQTEIFGPVVSVTAFDTDEEALRLANDTSYGLAAYLFTESTNRAWRMSEGLQFGMVAVNTGRMSMAQVPFGGIKQSGMGREGGRYGLDEYLQLKYRCQVID
ncbi:MAG: NAD-dependent succinate-semialdehyde dehydrogenase, partial [Myxococcota bacterium]|nr:NAD-dependent succinate-semialdehyde dehydrogenase [Myxococcota bacterium]